MWITGIAIWYLVKKYPIISGSGIPQIEGAIFGRFQFIHPLKALIAKFIGGVAGIGMGFSLGRSICPDGRVHCKINRKVGKG